MIDLTPSIARHAKRLVEIGFVLTSTAPGEKGPRHAGWNRLENALRTPEAAEKYFARHPTHGIGALLEFSGLVSLDIDHAEHSRAIFGHFGIDLDELRTHAPCIIGNPAKFRLMYRAPVDTELRHRTVMWPKQENLAQGFAVLELRAGPISDALPPTIHVGTGKAYRWENPPRNGFPPLPTQVLALWQDWPAFNRQALALCPWAPPPKEIPKPKARTNERPRDSVIAAFNSAHDVAAILEAHGYERRGKRFASPDTSHGAGVVLLDDGRVFCHHAGDPLSGEHACDAFDVYRLLDHRGDFRAAVRAAAQVLRLNRVAA